jgi:hypothetical protein
MNPARPKNYLAAIHCTHKALGLSKEDACALKQSVTGVASAGDMTEQQQKRYLAHLHRLQAGSKATKRPPVLRSVDDALDARWLKARALWAVLAAGGLVHTDTDAALLAYVKRQTHVDAWRFLNSYQINAVIEALKRWCERAPAPTEAAPHG